MRTQWWPSPPTLTKNMSWRSKGVDKSNWIKTKIWHKARARRYKIQVPMRVCAGRVELEVTQADKVINLQSNEVQCRAVLLQVDEISWNCKARGVAKGLRQVWWEKWVEKVMWHGENELHPEREGKELSLKPIAKLVGTPCATVEIQSSVAVYPVRRL